MEKISKKIILILSFSSALFVFFILYNFSHQENIFDFEACSANIRVDTLSKEFHISGTVRILILFLSENHGEVSFLGDISDGVNTHHISRRYDFSMTFINDYIELETKSKEISSSDDTSAAQFPIPSYFGLNEKKSLIELDKFSDNKLILLFNRMPQFVLDCK